MSNHTLARPIPLDAPPNALEAAMAQQRETLIDLEIVVADARDAVVRAQAELDHAIRERDRAVWHLAHLEELLDDTMPSSQRPGV